MGRSLGYWVVQRLSLDQCLLGVLPDQDSPGVQVELVPRVSRRLRDLVGPQQQQFQRRQLLQQQKGLEWVVGLVQQVQQFPTMWDQVSIR